MTLEVLDGVVPKGHFLLRPFGSNLPEEAIAASAADRLRRRPLLLPHLPDLGKAVLCRAPALSLMLVS